MEILDTNTAPEGDIKKEASARIDKGVLVVEIPLFMPNGEYIAYGMLHKAMGIVGGFFRHVEEQAKADAALGSRILTPTGMPPRS